MWRGREELTHRLCILCALPVLTLYSYFTRYFTLHSTRVVYSLPYFPKYAPSVLTYLSIGISSTGERQEMPALLTTATRGRGTLAPRWRTGARAARSFCTLLYAAASDASSVTSIRT